MRPITTAGLILLIGGIATLFLGGSFARKENLLEVGALKVTTETRTKVSPWIATAAILVGTVLLITSSGDRPRAKR